MSLNTVNVIAIDEEKLKFRVSVSFDANVVAQNQGTYKFLLPAPTNIANSDHYNQCTVKCNGFSAYCDGIVDPVWRSTAAVGRKTAAIDLVLDVPSSQTSRTVNSVAADNLVGRTDLGGYKDMLFLEIVSVGGGGGQFYAPGNTAGGAAPGGGGQSVAWMGKSDSDAILCGNPFGKTLTIQTFHAHSDKIPLWLASFAGGAADLGFYAYSFDITMVPNQ